MIKTKNSDGSLYLAEARGYSEPLLGYCTSRFVVKRRGTRKVMVGCVGVGENKPIRIQSMTTTPTQAVRATAKQAIALADAGCEMVRITVQNIKAAQALKEIGEKLRQAKVTVPLIADIHFLPNVAMEAAEHVEKIRINPGNYADKKRFTSRDYTDAQYEAEIQRLYQAFSPLVKRCKELGRAMRIGTNHGSLSDRIMNRYGDTPLGMVESALEFIRIAESHNFRDIILSMKASNPKVMIEAYRLAATKMAAEGMDYPLHLGVTEAGEGEDARIKSAIGIGSLLFDGLGDTIRVSLTEDPINEIPLARKLAQKAMSLWGKQASLNLEGNPTDSIDPYTYTRREVVTLPLGPDCTVAANEPPRVIIPANHPLVHSEEIIKDVCRSHARLREAKIEGLLVSLSRKEDFENLHTLAKTLGQTLKFFVIELSESITLDTLRAFTWPTSHGWMLLRRFKPSEERLLEEFSFFARRQGLSLALDIAPHELKAIADTMKRLEHTHLLFTLSQPTASLHPTGSYRALAEVLRELNFKAPLWIRNTVDNTVDYRNYYENRLLEASVLSGALLCDGLGDLISIETETDMIQATTLAYNILQGARVRVSKTEYIACPSCGRTLFDLQTTTQRIRASTAHLKGVTIAVMGCIVNGPGEMADADFGYVGGAAGKVNLYVGKKCVKYHIAEEEAVDQLLSLIKEHGKWTGPKTKNTVSSGL